MLFLFKFYSHLNISRCAWFFRFEHFSQFLSILRCNFLKFSYLQGLGCYFPKTMHRILQESVRNKDSEELVKFLQLSQNRVKVKNWRKRIEFSFSWIFEGVDIINCYSKVHHCWNPDSILWRVHQEAKFRLFRHKDLWLLGCENGKNYKSWEYFGFCPFFRFIFRPWYLCRASSDPHKTIYFKRAAQALPKTVQWSNLISSYQNIQSFKNDKISKFTNFR